jgi:TolA-binding protein
MRLDDHVRALRELGGDGAGDDGSATRLRVLRSLERGHAMTRHASVVAALVVLLVATASWGFATGRIQKLWQHEPAAPSPPPAAAAPDPPPPPAPAIARPQPAPAPPAPAPAPAPESPRSLPPAHLEPVATPAPPSQRYAHAHALYFHDGDYVAALDAFDDYLAAEPHGEFVAEARYNRALCLVRLGRLDEAKIALQPFADGTVLAGYRRTDATTLIEKIDRRLNGTK